MGLVQSQLDQLVSNAGYISQFFGTQPGGGFESGIDITGPPSAPVKLISSGVFEGSTANGYVDVFKEDVSGLYTYYQHIVSAPLTKGTDYAVGTQIGVLDNRGTPSNPNVDTGNGVYGSTGPHLEYGIATGPPAANAQYPNYANINPIPIIAFDLSSPGKNKNVSPTPSQEPGFGISHGTFVLGGIADALNKTETPQAISLQNGNPGPLTGQITNGLINTVLPSGVGAYLTLALLGVAAIVLTYALVKGGNTVNVNGNTTGSNT